MEEKGMSTAKKRLTLDLDAPLQRRLKSVAALKGVSMRHYCQTAIDKELARDEEQDMADLPFGAEAIDRFAALQVQVFGAEALPGDSAELIREARETRTAS